MKLKAGQNKNGYGLIPHFKNPGYPVE